MSDQIKNADNNQVPQVVDQCLYYAHLGWYVFPCHGITDYGKCTSGNAFSDSTSPGKRPATSNGQKDATSDPETIKRWWHTQPHYNIGVNCKSSGFFVIDIDPRNGGDKSFEKFLQLLGEPLPRTIEALTGEYDVGGIRIRGKHLYFKCDDDEKLDGNLSRFYLDGIDIKHNGYVITAPSRHISGVEYEWIEGHRPDQIEMAQAPEILLSHIRKNSVEKTTRQIKHKLSEPREFLNRKDLDISSILKNGIKEGERAVTIYKIACSLGNKYGTSQMDSEMIMAYLHDFNRDLVRPPLGKEELEKQVTSGISFVRTHPLIPISESITASDDTTRITELNHKFKILSSTTESQLAEYLGRYQFQGIICWTKAHGWLKYDGRKWKSVSTENIKEVIREQLNKLLAVAVQESESSETLKRHLSFATNSRITALESLLRGITEADASQFDQNPYLLNVKNGVIDLRTKELLPSSPKYLFTKITEVNFIIGAEHEDIKRALQAIPEECLDYLQVRIGQAASGLTPSDDKIIFAKGGGENGKSLLFTLCKIALGDFYIAVSPKLLGGSDFDHSTEKMPLKGARMAVLEELPDKGSLPMAKLKSLAGTTEITARAIRKDNVTWVASHSLFVTLNNLPNVADSDHGTWRRLEVFPFPFRFVTDVETDDGEGLKTGDPTLRSRILESSSNQAEAALAWIVDGAYKYFVNSARYPKVPSLVIVETDKWREECDFVLRILKMTVTPDPHSSVIATDFYAALRRNGLGRTDSDQQLVEKLKNHEWFFTNHVKRGRKFMPTPSGVNERRATWDGIRLILPVPPVPSTFS